MFNICARYEVGGAKALRDAVGGRKLGEGRRLSPTQEAQVRKLICDKLSDQLKMSYALWMRGAVVQRIRQRFGIDLPVRTLGLYLARWGFTPQKPIRRTYEPSPTAVRQWLDEDYPVIVQRAKHEGAEIHWGDETGLRRDDVRGRSFALKGKTPVVRINAKRDGLSVISSVTNKGQMRWKIFQGALNADILIDFLRRLVKSATHKVFLILDNLRVHHSGQGRVPEPLRR